jgi:NADH-quinone oxidoreductase subunit N
VDDLAGLSRSHPGVALMMALFLFSLIGIPLTAGFAGKVFLLWGALDVPAAADPTQARLFRILALIAALNAAVAAWYYLRLVTVMYLRTPLRPLENRRAVPGLTALGVCALLTLAFGVSPRPLLGVVKEVVPQLQAASAPTLPAPAVGQR